MFLNISQISQKKTCIGVSFNKVAGLQSCNFIKKRHQDRCFPVKDCQNFKNTYFEEHLRTTASEKKSMTELMKSYKSFKAIFATCKKRLLRVISCRCLNEVLYTDLFTLKVGRFHAKLFLFI